jgi:hypothetical protein
MPFPNFSQKPSVLKEIKALQDLQALTPQISFRGRHCSEMDSHTAVTNDAVFDFFCPHFFIFRPIWLTRKIQIEIPHLVFDDFARIFEVHPQKKSDPYCNICILCAIFSSPGELSRSHILPFVCASSSSSVVFIRFIRSYAASQGLKLSTCNTVLG